ncbi:MAG TPA: pyruvate kinase [Thermoanaerobaculia bacterium]|nr:pyruvate kinase [Thermoanaerobaculia bacterium]
MAKPIREPRATKIVATIGPRAETGGELVRLLSAGVDVVRLNGAHCRPGDIARRVALVRSAEKALGRPVGVLLDLGGPKIRVGPIEGDTTAWEAGDAVEIVPGHAMGSGRTISVTYPALLSEVAPGAEIRIADGLIRLKVERRERGALRARVLAGGTVRKGAGVNLPSSALSAPAVTPKDRRDLREGLEAGIQFVGLSFVRSVDHVKALRRLLAAAPAERRPWIVSKIERVEAVRALREIAAASDVLMVARGDLGVEIGLAAVPGVQRAILAVGREKAVPVIVATQMLESMVENPVPTRAEVSDVAGAVHDGADAVMLSGETAVGAHPIEAVRTMDEIARVAEAQRPVAIEATERSATGADHTPVVCDMAVVAARRAGARAMVVYTASGRTARLLSKEGTRLPIVAITSSEEVRRRLTILRNVVSYRIPASSSVEEMIASGDAVLRAHGLAGATVVEVSGAAALEGATNTVRIRTLRPAAR